MSLRTLLAALLVVAVALSGCAGGDDATSPTTSGDRTTTSTSGGGGGNDGTTTSTSSTSRTGSGGDNRAPTGAISASAEQGTIPLNVTFDLTGTDPDGDALTWNLDLDGDGATDRSGSTLPATESNNYTAAGVYNVTYVISDGETSVTYTVLLNLTAGSASFLQEVSGSYTSPPETCAYLNVLPQASDMFTVAFDVNPATIGKAFHAEYTPTVPAAFLRVDFRAEDGTYLGVTPLPPPAEQDPRVFDGVVPEGAFTGALSSCGGGQVSVTYTVPA